MKKSGEITVFISLVLVCVISLILGLLESARTAGARLYLQSAANSAADSLFSQYNRNLWEMYRLLFLEYGTEEALMESYEKYLGFYLNQKNLYPMEHLESQAAEITGMWDNSGEALEEEILAYIRYRLPEVAADLSGISEITDAASRSGDFRTLLDVCRQAGRKTRKLEKIQDALENSLYDAGQFREEAEQGLENESDGRFLKNSGRLSEEIEKFSDRVKEYEKELSSIRTHRMELENREPVGDRDAADWMDQEEAAYTGVYEAAERMLEQYREKKEQLKQQLKYIDDAEECLNGGGGDEEEPDWEGTLQIWRKIRIPEGMQRNSCDREKSAALDRVEELLDLDLLSLVLPEGTVVSSGQAGLEGIPSHQAGSGNSRSGFSPEVFLIQEYVFLYFSSFLEKTEESGLQGKHVLSYEQEYLLGGKESDRENLRAAADQLLALRGAFNLLYLLTSPERKSEADALAAAVTAGAVPAQAVVSFFILTLWAFGESVLDVRMLFAGERVPPWKNRETWSLDLEQLLSMGFLNMEAGSRKQGYDYEDYLRILLLLQDRRQKNFRIMDIIEWNVRTVQPDFETRACVHRMSIETRVRQKHLFLFQEEYCTTVTAEKSY